MLIAERVLCMCVQTSGVSNKKRLGYVIDWINPDFQADGAVHGVSQNIWLVAEGCKVV